MAGTVSPQPARRLPPSPPRAKSLHPRVDLGGCLDERGPGLGALLEERRGLPGPKLAEEDLLEDGRSERRVLRLPGPGVVRTEAGVGEPGRADVDLQALADRSPAHRTSKGRTQTSAKARVLFSREEVRR